MAAVGSRGRVDETGVKPGSDAYVGLLVISLLALTAAMLFAYLSWDQISKKPPAVQMAPVGGAARPPAAAGGNMPPPPSAPGPAIGQPNVPPQAGQQPPGNVPPAGGQKK